MLWSPYRSACLVVCLILVLTGRDGWAEQPVAKTYDLAARQVPGRTWQVDAQLRVGGQVLLSKDKRSMKLPISVVGQFRYQELPLAGANHLRSVRYYEEVTAVIKVDRDGSKPILRSDRRLFVADWDGTGPATLFSPNGPITREELDLVDILGNSLVLGTLLPDRPLAVGAKWSNSDESLVALLGLSAVSQCDVESVLVQVKGQSARIAVGGTVLGSAAGVGTELRLKGRYDFDLTLGQITQMELVVDEDRALGHVGPGLDVTARLTLKRHPVGSSERLARVAATLASAAVDRADLELDLQSAQAGFQLTHDRNWYVTEASRDLIILRRVDRGELLAQANISPLTSKSSDRQTNLAQFQKDIRFALNDRFGAFVNASQWLNRAGHQVYRVVARGAIEELPIEWRYYLVSAAGGHRVALAFTVEVPLADRLGDEDRRLVESAELFAPQPDAQTAATAQTSRPGQTK